MKKLLIVGALPTILVLVLIVGMFAGGGSQTAAVGAVATEEKSEEYGLLCAEMSVPWQVVILADSMRAYERGESGIEDVNPMETALEFLIMTEKKETWEVVKEAEDEDDEDEYAWVYQSTTKYTGKSEVFGYIGLTSADGLTPETLANKAQAKAANKSDDETRYTVIFYANTDYESILRKIGLSEESIAAVLELNAAGYMERYLSPEALERIRAVQARFGMYQFQDFDGDGISLGDVVFTDGAIDVVYYSQRDERWANLAYGSSTIGVAGCGPTSMAMVISTLSGQTVEPPAVCDWSVASGYWIDGAGSAHALIPAAAEHWGLPVSGCSPSEPQRIVDALAGGKLVVVILGPGTFTTCGHFLVMRGVTESGQILVADPYSVNFSNRTWDMQIFLNECRKGGAAGGPFWIIG